MDILSYILGKKAGGGGGEAVLINKSISANGTYNASADSADGYKKVEVAVPNTYAAGDEGKVVSNGALVAQGSDTVTANDTYDTTLISSLTVNVSASGTDYLVKLLNNTLTEYSSDEVTQVIDRGFQMCSSLARVSLPNCTQVKGNGFAYLSGLEEAHLPNVTTLASNAFDNCTKLGGIVLPKCTTIGNSAFAGCKLMEYADFLGGVNWNAGNVFSGCLVLDLIIIRSSTLQPMSNVNVLNNTPFKSGGAGGDIYIPKSLYDHLGDGTANDYKAATNWATYDGYGTITWHAIEGSYYETHYADGTVIS